MDVIVDRCAAPDVHKRTVMAAVRTPGPKGRHQQVKEFSSFTAELERCVIGSPPRGVTQVAMEATGVYWRPVWHVLEAMAGVELLLVNPRHVKNLPGRKTDVRRRRLVGAAARVRAAARQLGQLVVDGPLAERQRHPGLHRLLRNTARVGSVGIYSTGYQWAQITGGASLGPTIPNWVAGALNAKRAPALCSSSFSGGKVQLVQYPSGGFDANYTCALILS